MALSEKDLTDLPEGWRPEEGDVLVGTVLDVTKGWSDYTNDFYPIVVIQPKGKDKPAVSVHAFHAVLRNRLVELRPVAGETIGIKFGGVVKSKDGKRDISTYNVKVEGRTADVWGDLGGTPREAATVVTRDAADDDIPF